MLLTLLGLLLGGSDLEAYAQEFEQRLAMEGRVATRIEAQPAGGNYRWRAYRDAEPNALVLPGAKIWISTGLLSLLRSETELAFVLGHERAHVALGHDWRRERVLALEMAADARAVAGAPGLARAGACLLTRIDTAEARQRARALARAENCDVQTTEPALARLQSLAAPELDAALRLPRTPAVPADLHLSRWQTLGGWQVPVQRDWRASAEGLTRDGTMVQRFVWGVDAPWQGWRDLADRAHVRHPRHYLDLLARGELGAMRYLDYGWRDVHGLRWRCRLMVRNGDGRWLSGEFCAPALHYFDRDVASATAMFMHLR